MGQNIPPSFLGWSPPLQYWKGANIGRFCPHTHPTAWQSLLYILCIGVSRIYICRPELLLEHHTDKSNHPFHYSVDFSVICWPLCLTLRALGPSANLSLSVLTCRQMWVHLLNSLPPSFLTCFLRPASQLVSLPCFTHHPGWACWAMSSHAPLDFPFPSDLPLSLQLSPSSQWSNISFLLQFLLCKGLVICCLDLKQSGKLYHASKHHHFYLFY